jgi:GNAT superfamily N-acetyltransferase
MTVPQVAFVLRHAIINDWPTIMGLRIDAETRLKEMGLRQWYDRARGFDEMSEYLDHDEMYLILGPGRAIVGCVALTQRYDPEFWQDEDASKWLYLHKAITASWAKHCGVGAFMVSAALNEAELRGCKGVRLDVWRDTDGEGAVRRWKSLGFTQVGRVEPETSDSGILMAYSLGEADDH